MSLTIFSFLAALSSSRTLVVTEVTVVTVVTEVTEVTVVRVMRKKIPSLFF